MSNLASLNVVKQLWFVIIKKKSLFAAIMELLDIKIIWGFMLSKSKKLFLWIARCVKLHNLKKQEWFS